jgi:hypothetical protein
VSYVTYSPDAGAPPAELTAGSRRRVTWGLGMLLYIALCAVVLWWLKLPPPIKPPLASIPLPDGTELRLIGARVSREIRLSHSDDFEGRLHVDDYYRRGYGNTSWGSGAGVTNAEKPWLVFSRFDPRTKRFSLPMMERLDVIEAGTGIEFPAKISYGDAEYPVGIASFGAIPRRTAELTVRIAYPGNTVTAKIPNPFASTAPPFVAKPLPQRVETDGFVFELQRVKLNEEKRSAAEGGQARFRLSADVKSSAIAAPDARLGTSWTLFDATGNESAREILPTKDQVWGLRATAREFGEFPFPPEQVLSLGRIPLPAAGQAVPLALPEKLKEFGIVGIFAMGKGSYSLAYARNGIARLLSTGGGGNGGQVEVGSVPISGLSTATSFGQVGVWVFARTGGKPRHNGDLRARLNGSTLSSGGGGSSSSGHNEARHYAFDISPTALATGGQLELEFVYPRTRTAEFYFERPKLPGEN